MKPLGWGVLHRELVHHAPACRNRLAPHRASSEAGDRTARNFRLSVRLWKVETGVEEKVGQKDWSVGRRRNPGKSGKAMSRLV